MSFWWAHQSLSGGADFYFPDLGALPLGARRTARRLTYGNQADGNSKEPVPGRVSREGQREQGSRPAISPSAAPPASCLYYYPKPTRQRNAAYEITGMERRAGSLHDPGR
jgi:hypothetical protein